MDMGLALRGDAGESDGFMTDIQICEHLGMVMVGESGSGCPESGSTETAAYGLGCR